MITQERLKEVFRLDAETGILYWKVRTSNRGPEIGSSAGYLGNYGYWKVGIDAREYKRSRLVFLFCEGFLPEEVDHRNRIKTDDRPCNLRPATKRLNMANGIWPKRRGFPKGVYRTQGSARNPFRAAIGIGGGQQVYLGVFSTAEEAHAAYCAAAKKYFGEFARGS